jgi:hypothetical protein
MVSVYYAEASVERTAGVDLSPRPHVPRGRRDGSSLIMSFDGGCAGSPAPSPRHGRRAVDEDRAVCVGLDTHKAKIVAVAVAEPGRSGEVRFQGEIGNQRGAVRRLVKRLGARHAGSGCATRPARAAAASTARSPRSATTAPW